MEDQNELAQEYRAWVLAQQLDGCTLAERENGDIAITGELVTGCVSFYDIDGMCVVELRLERVADGEPAFFLHFELQDLERAKQLFEEMAIVVNDMNNREVKHVLLCCSCGMTTTFFAMKLNEMAQTLGLDYDFTAKPIEEAKNNGSEYAAVLLAPQVGYMRKEVVDALPGTPVIEVPGKIFGSYDAAAAMNMVVDVLSGSRGGVDKNQLQMVQNFDRTKRILAVSYVIRKDEPTVAYRVLDRGEIAESGMLVRRTFDFQTLEDLVVTLRVHGWNMEEFDAIGIAVPGVVNKGVLVEMGDGTGAGFDLAAKLQEYWGANVYVDFNAVAAAVGCYVSQDEYDDVVFHAQTIGIPEAEEGVIIDGKPQFGRGGRSGHLGPLASGFKLDMDLEEAAWRVTGMRQLVARYLASAACIVAPDVIYVWCDLLPDMEELHDELLKTLPEEAIPPLVSVSDYDECVLVGELALCLRRVNKEL